MATRTVGKTKLTPEVRQRLVEVSREAREVGFELMRLLMEQTNTRQAQQVPAAALQAEPGEVATSIGTEDRTLETESCKVSWKEPAAYLPKSRKAFFSQSKALGLGVDEDLSPSVMRKTAHLGAKLGSFASAAESVAETLEVELTTKRVERLTERIGRGRVAERGSAITDWEALPLVEKLAAPKGIKVPAVAGVSCDGERMQRCELPEDAKSHWCETKVGVLLEIAGNPHDCDPCPQVPTKFLDVVRMEQVTREIKRAVPKGQTFEPSEKSPPTPSVDSSSADSLEAVASLTEESFAEPPEVESRDVAAKGS